MALSYLSRFAISFTLLMLPTSAAIANPDIVPRLAGVSFSQGVPHARVCPDASRPGFAQCHARAVTDAAGYITANALKPNGLPAGHGPAQLRSAYNIPENAGAPSTIIAIVDAYGYTRAEADLAVYRATFGLPECTTANGCFAKFNQNGVKGSYPAQNTGWAQETALDLDMASAICPGCSIILVQANSASYGDLAKAVRTAAALGATVISNSYGGGESGTQTWEASYNQPGIAVTVSSGDGGYGVSFPASSPHVIAVGGTTLRESTTAARGWTETAWRGAGSGCSAVYPKPAWQTDPKCIRRTIADVSAVSDPATGVAVYAPTGSRTAAWQVYGGTSVAAPIIGAIYGVKGGPVVDGSLYANRTSLFDIVSGTNGSCGVAYLCKAVVGYDGPTGLGTPNGIGAF